MPFGCGAAALYYFFINSLNFGKIFFVNLYPCLSVFIRVPLGLLSLSLLRMYNLCLSVSNKVSSFFVSACSATSVVKFFIP